MKPFTLALALALATACTTTEPAGDPTSPEDLPDLQVDDPTFTLPPYPVPPGQVLAAFSGCLTFGDFQAAGMGPAWRSLNTSQNQACTTCHANGEYGFVATSDEELFFEMITSDKYNLLQYFALDLSDPLAPAVIVNEQSFAGVSSGTAPHQQHPRFVFDNPGMVALHAWHALAIARHEAGTCGPPKF